MNEKSKIKAHFQENWKLYAGVGIGVIFAGITCLIVKEPRAKLVAGMDWPEKAPTGSSGKAHLNGHTGRGKAHLNGHTVFTFENSSHNTVLNDSVITVLEREGRGHPGYLVRHKESDLVYDSQKAAADAFDFNYTHMSDHLNGRKEDIFGQHFERLHLAA